MYNLSTKRVNEIFGNEELIKEEAVIMFNQLKAQGNDKHSVEMSANFNQAVKNEDTLFAVIKVVKRIRSESNS